MNDRCRLTQYAGSLEKKCSLADHALLGLVVLGSQAAATRVLQTPQVRSSAARKTPTPHRLSIRTTNQKDAMTPEKWGSESEISIKM